MTVVKRVAHAREVAQRETFDRLAHELTDERRTALDGLLVTDPAIGMTRLRWLGTGPVEASPAAVKAEIAKLAFLRRMDAHTLVLPVLPAERRRFLTTVGRRLTAQALQRREPERRYPILLTLVAQSAPEVLDEVVQLFDQALSSRESKAAHRMRDVLAARAKSGEDRQALLDAILAIVADSAVLDEEVGGLIRGERIGWERLRSARTTGMPPLPRDHGHLAALDGSYGYLRQFTPQVLAAVWFAGGTVATELLEAVEVLRELNATGARKVPADAPAGFVPTLKFGHATASLLVGKLSASSRQNALAAALKEYGALRRTIYAARYLSDPQYRRKISRQLNKGESLHALKRDLLYAHEGRIRARHLEQQTEQAWCLTLITNAVVTLTTEYYGLAEVDIESELAQLGPTGYRPLRVRDTLF